MTPAARTQVAIEIIDEIRGGVAAEKALTNWARRHRFAGSKDRAAIRDHVFDAQRRWRSYASWGGGESGRQIMAGAIRAAGDDPNEVFTGAQYAPPPLSDGERAGREPEPGLAVALDCPDAFLPHFKRALGADCAAVLATLRDRAPVFLRVNQRRATRLQAVAKLGAEGIEVRPHDLASSALEVTDGERRLRGSEAYRAGIVELQDAASQAASDTIPVPTGGRVLDYCAGGGGKTLAMAARADARFFAHDINPSRMRDLPERAARAGVELALFTPRDLARNGTFDTVVCDVPCSGSGAWRRAPQGKWSLTPDRLASLCSIQDQVLNSACKFVINGGHLAYLTCSLFDEENGDRVAHFLRARTTWKLVKEIRFSPLDGGDGFYVAIMKNRGPATFQS